MMIRLRGVFNNIIIYLFFYLNHALYKEYKLIHYLLFIIVLFVINFFFYYIYIFIFKR